jgi:hypothetical protein
MRRARAVRALAAALAPALGVVSCSFDEQAVGPGAAQLVVHAVLNPARPFQFVLVERALSGRVEVGEATGDPADPVATGRGVPVVNARVVVRGPGGDSAVAVHEPVLRTDGKGRGVYRIVNRSTPPDAPPANNYLRVVAGGRYTLRVTVGDDVVTGETTIPRSASVLPDAVPKAFNRDRDSLFLRWDEVPLARRYSLRVDTPRGPLSLFLDSLEYLVAGDLRNVFTEGLPATFVPGFTQTVTVGAVDENFFDYYRSRNDPFTGTGLITHLRGGLGVFGSYVMLHYQTLAVVADEDEDVEGRYARGSPPRANVPASILLFVESRAGSLRQITGNWLPDGASRPSGLIGTWNGQRVTLALLRDQFVSDTVAVIDGRFDGRVLLGVMRGTGVGVEFRK